MTFDPGVAYNLLESRLESNPQPVDFKTAASPTAPQRLMRFYFYIFLKLIFFFFLLQVFVSKLLRDSNRHLHPSAPVGSVSLDPHEVCVLTVLSKLG